MEIETMASKWYVVVMIALSFTGVAASVARIVFVASGGAA